MVRSIDTRDFTFTRQSSNFTETAVEVSDALLGNHRVSAERVDPFTGGVQNLRSVNAGSTFSKAHGLGPADESLLEMALEHVRVVAPALGFAPSEKAEFVPDPHVKKTSTGERIVNLKQQYHGISVFQMERAVIFDKSGAIQIVTGSSVGLPAELETLPTVKLDSAAIAAANFVATPGSAIDSWSQEEYEEPTVDVSGYQPKVLGKIGSLPSQPAVLSKGPFGESILAHLVLFYQGPVTRLGWHFVISMPSLEAQYVVILEADSRTADVQHPEVLYAQKSSSNMALTRGNIWTHNPGINPDRQMVDFPRPVNDYPFEPPPDDLPETFPFPWIDGSGNLTIGNNTIAVLGNTLDSLPGTSDGEMVVFNPANAQGDEQKVLNIFYFCNFMHDFFFMLGFDELSGNFQTQNLTGLGHGGDPVLARAHSGAVIGTANMLTRADGVQALMNMGLVVNSGRHTAFDSDVVFHEYTHGVSNRLVGGQLDALALQQPQSRSMGEGWSDYFALTIQNYFLDEERAVLGSWVTNRAEGIRSAPYTDDYQKKGTYGKIGSPPYDEDAQGNPRVHNIGEIWCATLMKMNRDFGKVLGDKKRGHLLGWQIVVDGFKLTPANPSFLDARDAILRALEGQRSAGKLAEADFRKTIKAAWLAFAHFGMGPNARSVGASLEGIVEDRNPPPNL
ncbi:MAG TPA: M36 family metallopeptidase [Pyrinomonadaceae bacterium]|jgi:extracellular elastinolytic metalloproteinase